MKTLIELIVWACAYSPIYALFKLLNYLSVNVWGTRLEARSLQLMITISITLIAWTLLHFLIYVIIYKHELTRRGHDRVKIIRRGRGVLNKVFNEKHTTYIDTGRTYWVDNATIWCDIEGNDVGRITWIDAEWNRQIMKAKIDLHENIPDK